MTGDGVSNVRLASTIQAALNDLKRDAATTARELGLPIETIQSALKGDVAAIGLLIQRASAIWPITARHFTLVEDDVPAGLLVFDAATSLASSRILARGGVSYYEYRDTAMAAVSPIRPEWIRMLVTSSDNPAQQQVHWNKGHALHQLTYFLGDVNFFYEAGNQRIGQRMRAGDSALIPSFVPHTFTAVAGGRDCAILAVTFTAALSQDAIEDLVVSHRALAQIWGKFQTPVSPLKLHMQRAALTVTTLARQVSIDLDRLNELIIGDASMTIDEAQTISHALRVPIGDLFVAEDPLVKVEISLANASPQRVHKDGRYEIRQLAASAVTSGARGVEICVQDADRGGVGDALWTSSHHYGFVLSDGPVDLYWGPDLENMRRLQPGDSFYMKPWIKHAFAQSTGLGGKARILSFRCDGALGIAAFRELALLGFPALDRHRGIQSQWYN